MHGLRIIPISIHMVQFFLSVFVSGKRVHNDVGSSAVLAKFVARNNESLSGGDLPQANGNVPLATWPL
jgi:hypothetical protein